tara:strand:- start:398 stop:787 length:390 start_codon:yes stop_codon:yes gene_type:complete
MATRKKASAKTTKTTAKASKLEQMSQTHGKEENFQPTTLDQIWGDTGNTKYGTMDSSVYANKIKEMNRTDLFRHATTVGIVPIDDRATLEKRLVKEFNKHVSAYRKPHDSEADDTKLTKDAKKILEEGR